MTRTVLVLVLVAAFVAAVGVPVQLATADSGSISRDAKGPQPSGPLDVLWGPPTPHIFLLGQGFIFAAGLTLLIVAALLGVYTFMTARPHDRN